MSKRHVYRSLPTVLLLLLVLTPAMSLMPVPRLQGRVTDEAGILSKATREHISGLLKSHEDRTTNQVAVLTVTTLEGESIEEFATRVFDKWRLGQKKKDNGVLVIIAARDRRMRIEVGYGLEETLTDVKAGRIIDTVMAPRFKANDFDGGVTAGVLAVIALLEDSGAALPEDTGSSGKGWMIKGRIFRLYSVFSLGVSFSASSASSQSSVLPRPRAWAGFFTCS